MFFKLKKLKKIINKAETMTAEQFADCVPSISQHFHYGAAEFCLKNPESLVFWFLFKTDSELNIARENGLCDEITNTINRNLFELGYPKQALRDNQTDLSKITIDAPNKQIESDILNMLAHQKVSVSFTSEEDIQNKTNGDYRLYFQ